MKYGEALYVESYSSPAGQTFAALPVRDGQFT